MADSDKGGGVDWKQQLQRGLCSLLTASIPHILNEIAKNYPVQAIDAENLEDKTRELEELKLNYKNIENDYRKKLEDKTRELKELKLNYKNIENDYRNIVEAINDAKAGDQPLRIRLKSTVSSLDREGILSSHHQTEFKQMLKGFNKSRAYNKRKLEEAIQKWKIDAS